MVPGEQRTIEVEVKVLTKSVKRGRVAKIAVRTYRPAQKDFLNSGVDTPSGVPKEPVGNVRLTVGILTGNQYVAQNVANQTDDEGKRTVKVRLWKVHRTGPAELRVRALADHFSEQPIGNTCVEAQEGGYTEVMNAFTVR
jgi:hypothetical protein